MYDSVATLKGKAKVSYDKYGNEVARYRDREVYVQPRSVYNSEFYNAAQAGLHPTISFFISNKDDYDGEKLIEWEGKTYHVIRVDWEAQRDGLSLVCEEQINESESDRTDGCNICGLSGQSSCCDGSGSN